MKYITAVVYTTTTTSLYFQYLYKEDIPTVAVYLVPVIFFAPILLTLNEPKLRLLIINALSVFAFCVGFVLIAYFKNNNIWPIALASWLFISTPAILALNTVGYVYKRINT